MLKIDENIFDIDEENFSSEDCNKYNLSSLESLYSISVTVSAVLGRTIMPINQILRLGRGAIIELDRKIGDPIDILINDRLIARGEVVMVDESRLGVTMTEIIKL